MVFSGRGEFISNTSSPVLDGEVSTSASNYVGARFESQSISAGDGLLNVRAAASANDDEANQMSAGVGYSYNTGDASYSAALEVTESNDGDETLMPNGLGYEISMTSGNWEISYKSNDGNDYDKQDKISLSYTTDTMAGTVSHSSTEGVGEYDDKVDMNTFSLGYIMSEGWTITGYMNHTDGTDTGSSASTKRDSFSAKLSYNF